jgi:hypothetical protein
LDISEAEPLLIFFAMRIISDVFLAHFTSFFATQFGRVLEM